MLGWFSLILFGGSCLLLIADGFRRRSGIFHFPFLAGCGLLGFLFPQALGIVRNPELAPEAGVIKALLMCALCALALRAGWRKPAPPRWAMPNRETKHDVKLAYWLGIGCLAVGCAGFVRLTALSGGLLDHYSVHGNYALEWRGLPVVYVFFVHYFFPGLVLTALAAIRLRSKLRMLPALVPLAVTLASIVFLGRRTEFVWLCVTVGCIAYFAWKITPPRSLVLASAAFAGAAMFLMPAYRIYSQIGADTAKIREINARQTLSAVVGGTEGEFRTMAYLVQIAESQRLFQFGAGFYNAFIAMFVPKLIFGEEFKASLFIDLPTARQAENSYSWVIPYGMVPTGPYTAYEQFWYLGCMCFYFLARAMRYLWTRAATVNSLWAQATYVLSVTFAVAAVVNDIYAVYIPLFMFVLPGLALRRLLALPRPGIPRIRGSHGAVRSSRFRFRAMGRPATRQIGT